MVISFKIQTEEGQWWTEGEESSDELETSASWFFGNNSHLASAAFMDLVFGNYCDFFEDITSNDDSNDSNGWHVESAEADSSASEVEVEVEEEEEENDISLSSISEEESISDSDGDSSTVSEVVRATHNYWEVEEFGMDEASSESGL